MNPWRAREHAVDQCIEAIGFDECSRMLEGSNNHLDRHARDRPRHSDLKVSFSNLIEVIIGGVDDSFSSCTLSCDDLRFWSDKPWNLHIEPSSIVEPLSDMAVSSPMESECSLRDCRLTRCSLAHSSQSDGQVREVPPSFLDHLPEPTDLAIYDRQSSWLPPLRSVWREHATREHAGEGRTLPVKTWYLHHDDVPRCSNPRTVHLDYMDHLWLGDLRAAWAHMIRDGEPLHLTFVVPTPPRADDQPFAPHVILSQGHGIDRAGTVMTARFIEDHRTQLLQEAVSAPDWMCGSRAVDLLRIAHLTQDRRWVARSGIMMFAVDELEQIPDGIAIDIDIRVPQPEEDIVSFAAWTRRNYPPDQPIFELPQVVQNHEHEQQPEPDADESSSSDDEAADIGQDWRFTHVFRTRRRVFHGHLPWDDAFTFQQRVAALTNVDEDDIAFCHHVEHRPADLQAAHTEVLLMQTVSDLPIGSVHRLVLVDIEFHEHWPSTDHSTSRRCLSLPHQVHRRTLLRLLGLETYCEKQRSKCLMWRNHQIIKLQRHGTFFLEHGDYLRLAVPPEPKAALTVSTRSCVSQSRHRRGQKRLRHHARPRSPQHEGGMTEADDYERRMYPQHADDDVSTFVQQPLPYGTPRPLPADQMLMSEVAQLCSSQMVLCPGPPGADASSTFSSAQHPPGTGHTYLTATPDALASFTRRLHEFLSRSNGMQPATLEAGIYLEVWFSDHLRRPHSGIGRLVLLPQDSIDWMTAIIAAWDDLLDPTLPWSCHTVETHVGVGDPDAAAQLILVQNPQPDHVSVLATVYGGEVRAGDAVLMCYTLPRSQPHQHLMRLIAQGLHSGQQPTGLRTWWSDLDITDIPQPELQHGAALVVCAQTPSSNQFDGGNPNAAHDDVTSMLQHQLTTRTQIQLERLVPVPAPSIWVEIDCQRLDFLRNQLRSFPPIQPMFDRAFCDWHSSTSDAFGAVSDWSGEIPVGFTFYTDGSSHRGSGQAAAAVVLVVTTADGPRWGGFATTSCLGSPSAPRAEATALMLAIRWCLQLSAKYKEKKPWYEFAFDCQHVAGIAQGRQGGDHNCDLHLPIRALLHWIESDLSTAFTWTHLRSHHGHPWNEAADALCKHTLNHDATLFDLDVFHQQCTFDGNDLHMIQWLWLFERSLQGCPDAPPLVHLRWRLDIAQPLLSEPNAAIHPAMKRRDLQPDGPREMVHLNLQVGTANVLTLYPEQDHASRYMGARAESLARQFHEYYLQIIGLQETRSRLDGHTMLDNYHVLSAPAQKRGHGGVQL